MRTTPHHTPRDVPNDKHTKRQAQRAAQHTDKKSYTGFTRGVYKTCRNADAQVQNCTAHLATWRNEASLSQTQGARLYSTRCRNAKTAATEYTKAGQESTPHIRAYKGKKAWYKLTHSTCVMRCEHGQRLGVHVCMANKHIIVQGSSAVESNFWTHRGYCSLQATPRLYGLLKPESTYPEHR
jgi:hypothetical protein